MTEQNPEPPPTEPTPEPLKLDVPVYEIISKGADVQPKHPVPPSELKERQ